ncbi:MAG: OmpA family protein, partial [Myxococcota bacterium]
EFFGRLGVGYRFGQNGGIPLELDASLAAATSAQSPYGQANRDYTEALLGATYDFAGPLLGFAGGGIGLTDGFGTPDWRVFAGIRFSPRSQDSDGDGIDDADDRCPEVPEDRDQFQDEDGCEDVDNDQDGVPDQRDGAPLDAEDKDGFQDEDGVPDPDNDGDSVLDAQDACPVEAGPVEHRGCPIKDADQDGIPDADDLCPKEPGTSENKGCPDRDGDGVVDRLDNCPDVKGTADNAGCEKEQLVRISARRIEILDLVYFRTASAVIDKRSFPLLDNVASVINSHPEISLVRVEGHTDASGSTASNQRLSQRRAESVVAYIVKRGVAPSRLTAVGYGETKPVASNVTPEGRSKNRRVEFTIVDRTATQKEAR